MAGTSDLDRQIEQLRRCEYIKEAEVKSLCAKAREILVEESNVERVDSPVTVSTQMTHPAAPDTQRRLDSIIADRTFHARRIQKPC